MKVTASKVLTKASKHLDDRGKSYDSAKGERSMERIVGAFNTITDSDLTEEQGWLFMSLLKMVRSQQSYKEDNYEDEAAYAALRGECAAKSQPESKK